MLGKGQRLPETSAFLSNNGIISIPLAKEAILATERFWWGRLSAGFIKGRRSFL